MIVDSHAHLDMPQFDADRHEVVQRAWDAGVERIIAISSGAPHSASIQLTLELAERYDFVWAGIGVSPHDARLADQAWLDQLEVWAEHRKVAIWGEIGLDYFHDLSPRDVQRDMLRCQLHIARRRRLPVSLHCRDAWEDLFAILRAECPEELRGAVLHSFTGTRAQALEAAALGFYVSFSGIVTFRNAAALQDAARALPLEQILVESDCPYLAPVPHRGKRNEPAFVLETGRALARIREQDFALLARETSANACRFLGRSELRRQS
jgi:TatD DNase family protein